MASTRSDRVISLERDCAGEGLLGRRQDGRKGTKNDRNGVDGLWSQPRQNFSCCLQCSCPGTVKAVLGVGMARVAPFKFLATCSGGKHRLLCLIP